MQSLDLHSTDKYCVFRSGADRYCVPALAIRNVGPRPTLCPLPLTSDVLAGLAHEQREIIPVYSFSAARGGETDSRSERQVIVLMGDPAPWGLLVDEVLGLETLELSLHAHRGHETSWSSVNVGSTAFRDQFVTAIDTQNLFEFIQHRLHDDWSGIQRQRVESAEAIPDADHSASSEN
jgi:chemotaxis signal transduction protein